MEGTPTPDETGLNNQNDVTPATMAPPPPPDAGPDSPSEPASTIETLAAPAETEPEAQVEEAPAAEPEGPAEPAGWSATKRTSEPFVFRAGGVFGSGKKVRTIGDAIHQMDTHPDDGIYHLQNGTLAQWLEGQEAFDLAHLARQVVAARYPDPRVMLETFLIGTGLVRRPVLSLRPARLWMGYILAGQTCSRDLQIRKGRGRGYMFGKLHSSAPWLRLEPPTFSGDRTVIHVGVDSHTLPVKGAVQEATFGVESSATEQPVRVPVQFRVMGVPSVFNRFITRPVANALVAGLIGALLGWLLQLSMGGWPGYLRGEELAPAPIISAAAIAALWAILGGIRGLLQPLAWPIRHTLGRWLLRSLLWGTTLVLMAAAVLWVWRQIEADLNLRAPAIWAPVLIAVASLAVFPGILGELWITRSENGPASVAGNMPIVRSGLMLGGSAAILALLLVGARYAAPAVRGFDPKSAAASAQEWSRGPLGQFDTAVNGAIDQFYLRTYDRRATTVPAVTVTPSPAPTSAATPQP